MADENIGKSVNEGVDKHMNNQAPTPQFITVDATKLNKGLRTTFWGVALIFDSLGMPADISNSFNSCVKAVEDNKAVKEHRVEPVTAEPEPVGAVPKAEVKAEVKAEDAPQPEPVIEENVSTDASEPQEEKEPQEKKAKKAKKDEAQSEAPQPDKTQPEKPEPNQAAPSVSVSVDDITKIIVQKIKQNRKNNEKIGAILKTYGASKVGELPEDKYEAFLTDLSAI